MQYRLNHQLIQGQIRHLSSKTNMADTPFIGWTVHCSGTIIQINFSQYTNVMVTVGSPESGQKRFTTAASALDVEMSWYWFERSEHLGCRFTFNSLVFCLSFCGHWADYLNWPTGLSVSMKKKKRKDRRKDKYCQNKKSLQTQLW